MPTMCSRFFLTIPLLLLLGASCIRIQLQRTDGGVFSSTDRGQHWQAISNVLSAPGTTQTLATQDIADLVMDPQNSNTLYALFRPAGLALTNNSGVSWTVFEGFQKRNVAALAVNPQKVCTVFVASGNTILKTDDCLRTFQTIYIDPRTDATVTTLAIPFARPQTIYAGLATGEVIVSTDGGQTWTALTRFNSDTKKIVLDPQNADRLWAVTRSHGVFASHDRGATWQPQNENIGRFGRVQRIFDLRSDASVPGGLLALTESGLFRSKGDHPEWESVNIIPSPGSAFITTVAVDPVDSRQLYYTAQGTLYSSTDNGVRWKSIRLPSTRLVSSMLIDPQNPDRLFIATTR